MATRSRKSVQSSDRGLHPVKIYTLGRFKILNGDQPLLFSRKVQRRPLALLKAVIGFGGRNVAEKKLVETLWPQAHADAARFSLTSAIHRLRRLLGHPEVIVRKDGKVSLDPRHCWVDAWVVERILDQAEGKRNGVFITDGISNEIVRLVQRAADLYEGSFLSGENEQRWAMPFGVGFYYR